MSVRDWGKGPILHRWLQKGRRARTGMAVGLVLAVYSVIIVTPVTIGEADMPWLPTNASKGEYWAWITALLVAGAVIGFARRTLSLRRAMRSSANQDVAKKGDGSKPLHGDLNSYALGTKWTLTGRRLWTFGLLVYAPIVPIIWLNLTQESGKPFIGGVPWIIDESSWVNVWLSAHCCFWMLWAFVLKGREVRRGKERIKVADEYLSIREDRLRQEFDGLCEKFLEQQQEWKAKKTEELYKQILDQQARGVLPCPNCEESERGKLD